MKKAANVNGVLDQTYAMNRQYKPHFVFRYKVRAKIVAMSAKKYLGISKALRILDFGAAEGLTFLEFRRLLPLGTYVGIEDSDELFQRVFLDGQSDSLIIKGDVTKLPNNVKDASYDIVSALAILEHLSNPIEAVHQAKMALRPGGIFIATCPSPSWDIISTRLGLLAGDQHASKMDKKYMINIMQEAGLEVLSYQRFMWAPIGLLPYIKIHISPSFSLILDQIISRLKIFNWLFVNQYVIARKPL